MSLSDLPHVNVALNALSAVLLTAGYIAIRMRRVRWHRGLMIAAMIASALFLASYLTYHFGVELTRKYTGTWRTFYYVVLPIHVIGAMVNLPMVLVTDAWHAFRRQLPQAPPYREVDAAAVVVCMCDRGDRLRHALLITACRPRLIASSRARLGFRIGSTARVPLLKRSFAI
jgi:putative membrane protein